MSKVIEEIAAERWRQISAEGWTLEHDDWHRQGQLARAAACYAMLAAYDNSRGLVSAAVCNVAHSELWPWDNEWWKPKQGVRRCLVKAAALIVAEIERMDRHECATSVGSD